MNHPNISKLFEVIDKRTNVTLVMEMCNGKNLYHFIKKKASQKLDEGEAKNIFRQIVSGVSYLHKRGVSHRDLKLDNILIDPTNANLVKIIDFGFSVPCKASDKLTVFCGTPHFMDPDIVKKNSYNGHAADVWAVGVMLFICLTGKYPFFAEFEADLYRKI